MQGRLPLGHRLGAGGGGLPASLPRLPLLPVVPQPLRCCLLHRINTLTSRTTLPGIVSYDALQSAGQRICKELHAARKAGCMLQPCLRLLGGDGQRG